MPTKVQLQRACRERSAKIRAVAQHFRQTMLEPLPIPTNQNELAEYLRESSLTAAVAEYLRAKHAEREN